MAAAQIGSGSSRADRSPTSGRFGPVLHSWHGIPQSVSALPFGIDIGFLVRLLLLVAEDRVINPASEIRAA